MVNCKECPWHSCVCCNEFLFRGSPESIDRCYKCERKSEFELNEFFEFCPKTGEEIKSSL